MKHSKKLKLKDLTLATLITSLVIGISEANQINQSNNSNNSISEYALERKVRQVEDKTEIAKSDSVLNAYMESRGGEDSLLKKDVIKYLKNEGLRKSIFIQYLREEHMRQDSKEYLPDTLMFYATMNKIISNYDSLVVRVNKFSDIEHDSVALEFKEGIEWYLKDNIDPTMMNLLNIKHKNVLKARKEFLKKVKEGKYKCYVFFIGDDKKIENRKITMLLKVRYFVDNKSNSIVTSYEEHYLPIFK